MRMGGDGTPRPLRGRVQSRGKGGRKEGEKRGNRDVCGRGWGDPRQDTTVSVEGRVSRGGWVVVGRLRLISTPIPLTTAPSLVPDRSARNDWGCRPSFPIARSRFRVWRRQRFGRSLPFRKETKGTFRKGMGSGFDSVWNPNDRRRRGTVDGHGARRIRRRTTSDT